MEQRRHRLLQVMVVERFVVGALLGLAPRITLRLFGAPANLDSPIVRYAARLFGIRNAMLGVLLWQQREDPAQVGRLATLNAATEAVDALSASVLLLRRQGLDRTATAAGLTSIGVMAGFLRLRALAEGDELDRQETYTSTQG